MELFVALNLALVVGWSSSPAAALGLIFACIIVVARLLDIRFVVWILMRYYPYGCIFIPYDRHYLKRILLIDNLLFT